MSFSIALKQQIHTESSITSSKPKTTTQATTITLMKLGTSHTQLTMETGTLPPGTNHTQASTMATMDMPISIMTITAHMIDRCLRQLTLSHMLLKITMVSFHTKVTIRILAKNIITDMEISTSVMASVMTLVRLSTNLVIIKNMTTDIASDMMAMNMVTDTALAMKGMDTVSTILHITH